MIYRPLDTSEYYHLPNFLFQAIYVPENSPKLSRSIIDIPEISIYIDNFGKQPGDRAIVAEDKGKIVGILWGRKFQFPNVGYGYISDDIPEISISILPEYRNQGIGTQLLKNIMTIYENTTLSLSVDKKNPAIRLYQRVGFIIHSDKGDSVIMKTKSGNIP